MRHDPHSYIRPTEATAPASLSDAPFYPEDLLPALQDTLAARANLEVGFEIARDSLEAWSGPEEERQRHRAELEQLHQQTREPLLRHLAGLQGEPSRSVRPIVPLAPGQGRERQGNHRVRGWVSPARLPTSS